MSLHVDLIGATTSFGQPKPGVILGPDALRVAGIVEVIENEGHKVNDLGNVRGSYPSDYSKKNVQLKRGLKNFNQVLDYSQNLSKVTSKSVENNHFPLTVGGDHSLALGSVSGIAPHFQNLGVIWFDAHGDLNSAESSPSGNIHGMILAQLLGVGDDKLIDIDGHGQKIQPENLVLIGMRDLDDGEKELIKRLNILTFTMSDIRKKGLHKVLEQTLEHLAHCDGLHLSFDVDSIDPLEMVGTGTRVRGGLFISEVIMFMEGLNESNRLTSMDLVEVNPLIDINNQAAETATLITEYIFGKRKL